MFTNKAHRNSRWLSLLTGRSFGSCHMLSRFKLCPSKDFPLKIAYKICLTEKLGPMTADLISLTIW